MPLRRLMRPLDQRDALVRCFQRLRPWPPPAGPAAPPACRGVRLIVHHRESPARLEAA